MRIHHLSLALLFVCPIALAQADGKKGPSKQDIKKAAREAEKSAKAAAKAKAAEYKAKGYKKVKDVWVAKEHLTDAKKGVYHHDGEKLNRYEIMQVQSGKVRHPVTKQFIAAADLAKAKDKFPIGNGVWGTKEEANKYHSEESNPWFVRTAHCNIASTLPIDTILFQIASQVDGACSRLMPLFGGATPPPDRRPTVVVLPSLAAYTKFGEDNGGAGSTHGAFLTPEFTLNIDGSQGRVGAAYWEKNWGPYFVRHAAGVALSYSICGEKLNDELPEWFHRALGGYVERHYDDAAIKFFGDAHKKKGGVKGVTKWLADYKISSELPERGIGDLSYNIFQAGLLVSFGMRGGNEDVTEGLQKVSAAFASGKKVGAAVKAFGHVLGQNEADLKVYLDKVTK